MQINHWGAFLFGCLVGFFICMIYLEILSECRKPEPNKLEDISVKNMKE